MPRATLRLTDDAYERLCALKVNTGCTTHVEVFRRALALMEHLVLAEMEGGQVQIKARDGDVTSFLVRR